MPRGSGGPGGGLSASGGVGVVRLLPGGVYCGRPSGVPDIYGRYCSVISRYLKSDLRRLADVGSVPITDVVNTTLPFNRRKHDFPDHRMSLPPRKLQCRLSTCSPESQPLIIGVFK